MLLCDGLWAGVCRMAENRMRIKMKLFIHKRELNANRNFNLFINTRKVYAIKLIPCLGKVRQEGFSPKYFCSVFVLIWQSFTKNLSAGASSWCKFIAVTEFQHRPCYIRLFSKVICFIKPKNLFSPNFNSRRHSIQKSIYARILIICTRPVAYSVSWTVNIDLSPSN